MKAIAILTIALALAGCESMRVLPAGVNGNSEFVTISNVWNVGSALPYAEKHCAQYGKIPRASANNAGEYAFTFDCVKGS